MDRNPRTSQPLLEVDCGIPRLMDARRLWVVCVAPIFALLLLAMPAIGQAMPENASPKSYGDGWECDIGYRLKNWDCLAIVIPANAYETNRTYGSGWECHHGFREVDETACVAVVVPDGGFLDPSGERWRCLRGFVKVNDACQEVLVPENAYLVDGSNWECSRGFEKANDGCSAIEVPLNGYLNGSRYGQPWSCERGFFERNDLCEAVVIPEFAYFDDATYGEGWKCQRGYVALDGGCQVIEIPANAHLDRTGNRWACNRNFQKSQGECVLNN